MSQPAFWSDRARADELIKELGILSNVANEFEKLESLLGTLEKNVEDQKFFDAKKMFRALSCKNFSKVRTMPVRPCCPFSPARAARMPRIGRGCSALCTRTTRSGAVGK